MMNLFATKSVASVLMDNKKLATYLSPTTDRYNHILGVVQTMKNLLPQLDISNEWKPMLIQACYLHDIGYSNQLNQYQHHPLDGAIFASNHSYAKPIISAVLFHSCALKTIENNRHDLLDIYQKHYKLLDEKDHMFIDLVTYCDIHTSPRGKSITFNERIKDVVDRYGPDHDVSKLMIANRPFYEKIISMVNNLIG